MWMRSYFLCWCKFIGIFKSWLDSSYCCFLFFPLGWCRFGFVALCFGLLCSDEHHFSRISWVSVLCCAELWCDACVLVCMCNIFTLLCIFFKWNVSIFIGDFIIIDLRTVFFPISILTCLIDRTIHKIGIFLFMCNVFFSYFWWKISHHTNNRNRWFLP